MQAPLKKIQPNGGTSLYEALIEALKIVEYEDLSQYSPAIIIMSDGMPNGSMSFQDLKSEYTRLGIDVPIFTILFGSASTSEMEDIAKLSRARVFDGRENLAKAFQSVRGYN